MTQQAKICMRYNKKVLITVFTFQALPSRLLETLSGATVSENAGQGLECSNFLVL